MNELNELDLGIHVYYCAITQMVSMNELNGLDLEFFAACSNNLTLDYNIRKAVHRINIHKFRRLQRYSGARSGSPQLITRVSSSVQ